MKLSNRRYEETIITFFYRKYDAWRKIANNLNLHHNKKLLYHLAAFENVK